MIAIPKATLIDRIVSRFSPGRGLRRRVDRGALNLQAGGYASAEPTRFRNQYAFNRSYPLDEDHLIGRRDRQITRLECRDLWRTNEIVRGAVDRFTDYAVWKGIYPQPQTKDSAWNKLAADWWAEIYVPTADFRQMSGVDLITDQKLMVSHRMLDGDMGFVLLKNGQIQPIEADRIATPEANRTDQNIIEGIKRTPTGLILGYYICDRNSQGNVDLSKSRYIKRENFIFCYKPIRIDQVRGIPDLAPCVNKLRDYDETDLAVLNKIKLDAYQQFKRWTVHGLSNERIRDGYQLAESGGKNPERVKKEYWGTEHHLGPDEDMEAFESKTPNTQYVQYLKHELQVIAACLNISYEILMLIFTDGSFSSQRAALIHNKHTFLDWNNWVATYMDRLYNWRIAKAIKHGDLPPAPTITRPNGLIVSEWWKKTWTVPYFDWVDPLKQASADIARYNMGVTSITEIINSIGGNRDDVFGEKTDDIMSAIQKAAEINKEHPEAKVTWRDIIQTSVPGQITAAQADAEVDQDKKPVIQKTEDE